MSGAALTAVLAGLVLALLLGGFLFMVGRVLGELNRQLGAVVEAVGSMAADAEPVDSAVRSINRDLGSVQELLSSLRQSESEAPTGSADPQPDPAATPAPAPPPSPGDRREP